MDDEEGDMRERVKALMEADDNWTYVFGLGERIPTALSPLYVR